MASSLERRAVERVVEAARAAGVEVPREVAGIAFGLEHGAHPGLIDAWRDLHPGEDPDAVPPTCCYGAAVYGWERCTCWEPVFDVEQAPALPGDPTPMPRRCGDCAFRKDSPERADALTEEELLALAWRGETFWCHDGMRRPVAYRHPLLGEVPGDPADWQPLIVDGVPRRADGTVASQCAGWAQERRLLARRETVEAARENRRGDFL